MRPIRILHISDLHERAAFEGMPSNRAATLERDAEHRGYVLGPKLTADLQRVLGGGAFDLVVFTGDLADWAIESEYTAASRRIASILATVGATPQQFFAIPGNHDVDRKINEEARTGILRAREHHGVEAIGRWMRWGTELPGLHSDWRAGVLERTDRFWKWHTKFRADQLRPKGTRPLGYRHTYRAGELADLEVDLHIIGLDSAWLCGDDNDQGRIFLSGEQIAGHIRVGERPLNGIRIALIHHPLDHLADHHDARKFLADDGVDVLLHGHQHHPLALSAEEAGHSLRIIASGCLVEGDLGRNWPNSFQVIEIDQRTKNISVAFRKWSKEGRFWGPGSDIYEAAPDGCLTMESLRPEASVLAPPQTSTDKAPTASSLVALGPRTLALGERTKVEGDRWTLRLDRFLTGGEASITAMAEATTPTYERCVVLSDPCQAREVTSLVSVVRDGGRTFVTVAVADRMPRRQFDDYTDLDHNLNEIKGQPLQAQIFTNLMEAPYGMLEPGVGTWVPEWSHTPSDLDIFPSLVEMDIERMASVGSPDGKGALLDYVRSFKVITTDSTRGLASIEVEFLGGGKRTLSITVPAEPFDKRRREAVLQGLLDEVRVTPWSQPRPARREPPSPDRRLPTAFVQPKAVTYASTGREMSPLAWKLTLQADNPNKPFVDLHDAVQESTISYEYGDYGRTARWPRPLKLGQSQRVDGAIRWSFDYSTSRNNTGSEHLTLKPDGELAYERQTLWDCDQLAFDFGTFGMDLLLFVHVALSYAQRVTQQTEHRLTVLIHNPRTDGPIVATFTGTPLASRDNASGTFAGPSILIEQDLPTAALGDRAMLHGTCYGALERVANVFEATGQAGSPPFLSLHRDSVLAALDFFRIPRT